MRSGALVRVLAHEAQTKFDVHAVWTHTRYLPAKLRVVIDALAIHIPRMMAAAQSDTPA